jgi:hypothetical protein
MNDDMLELSMWRDGNIMHGNCLEDMKKLKEERDEARALYCRTMADIVKPYRTAEDIAKDRNWHCFRRDTLSQKEQ